MAGMFGSKPTPQAPAPMPDNNNPAVLEAQRKAAMDAMARSGRSSTILSGSGDRSSSNPDSYSGKTLGSGN